MGKIDREGIKETSFLTKEQLDVLNLIEDDDDYRKKALEFFMDNVNNGGLFDGKATAEMTIE